MLGEAGEEMMSDMVIAANPGDGIRLSLYTSSGAVVAQVKLSWRKAALHGSDLVILAVNESKNEAQQLRTGKIESGK
jgi:hypothetical protein